MKAIPKHHRAGVAVLVVSAALPLACWAGVNAWTGNGPQGGSIRHVEFNPDGDVAFATSPAGLYQSTDEGIKWTLVNASVGSTPFAIDPLNPEILYFVNFAGSLMRSNDSGATVVAVDNWIGGTSTAVDVGGPGTSVIYAGTSSEGVVRSIDGGASWHIVHGVSDTSDLPQVGGEFAAVDGIFIDPTDASTAYATYSTFVQGIYRTTDGGAHWFSHATGMPLNTGVAELAIDAAQPQNLYAATDSGVFYSTDGAGSWHAGTGIAEAATVAIDAANPTHLYAGTFDGGLYKSIDSGQTWVLSNTGLSPSAVRGIATHPSDGNTVLAATTEGMSRSADAGLGWMDVDSGIVASDVVALATDPVLTGNLLASTTGIHRSTKAGSSWSEITDVAATALVFDPTGSSIVYAAANGVQKSTDGGLSWISKPIGADTDMLAFSASDGSIYALDSKGLTLYRSLDGADHWTTAGTDIVASEPLALIVDSAAPDTLYIGTSKNGACKSTDGGVSCPALSGLSATAVSGLAQDPTNPSIIYAATDGGVFRSSNAGTSWSAAAADLVSSITVVPAAPEILYGTSSDGTGILRSLDSGASWVTIPVGAPAAWVARQTALDAVVKYRVYAATQTNGVQTIDLAHDLQLSLVAPTTVGIDADFEYVSTITNAGPGDAPRVALSQSIPTDKATFVSAVPDQGSCAPPSGTQLSCDLGTLAEGASVNVRVTMTSGDRGVLNSSVTVSDFDKELTAGDNAAVAPVAQITQLYDLVANVTAPATVSAGNNVTYTATATNDGPNDAGGVTLVTEAPSGTTFVSAVTTLRCTRADLVLTCNAGTLASGATAEIDVTYSAARSGALAATLTISATGGTDSDPSNDTASATTQANSSSSGGGGGAFDPLALLVLLALNRRRSATLASERA